MSNSLQEALRALIKATQTLAAQQEQCVESLSVLRSENEKRRLENQAIQEILKPVLTDSDATTGATGMYHPEGEELGEGDQSPGHQFQPPRSRRHTEVAALSGNNHRDEETRYEECQLKSDKDLLDTIKPLRRRDDSGVEDFTRMVMRAKSRCFEPDILLDKILATKIIENAERSIRHLQITCYDEFFKALRTYVFPSVSRDTARDKMCNIVQGKTESVMNYTLRFGQRLNEYRYAIQNGYTRPTIRKLFLVFAIRKRPKLILKICGMRSAY